MKRVIFTLLALSFAIATVSAQKTVDSPNRADKVVRIWDNSTAPHSNEETKDENLDKHNFVGNTSQLALYIYKAPKAKNTRRCIVILPGGGYSRVCITKEGYNLAEWLSSEGITAIVVKYRLPNNGHKEVPLEDAAATIEYMRNNAKRLGIDPQKIGVSGSSAGGHLAAWSSVVLEGNQKPNFAVLLYPVISGQIWSPKAQWSTFDELLGHWRTPAEMDAHSVDLLVNPQTPPTLILLSDDDDLVPSQNSTIYYKALKYHGVKAAMHVFPSGGHGWAGKDDYLYADPAKEAIADWLKIYRK